MRPTIRDVASKAGVSIATVSRALRDPQIVSPATQSKVAQAAAELEYVPSHLGRQLAERRHAANGIVFPDLSGPYFAEVVLGYEDVAAELGRSVLLLSTHGREGAPAMVTDLAGRTDGLVVLGRTVSDDVLHTLARRGIPLVLLARTPLAEMDSLNAENRATARALADHLTSAGVRAITFVGDPAISSDVAERLEGLESGAEAAGATVTVTATPELDEQSGIRVGRAVLKSGRLPEAFACANDELALGLMTELRSGGVDVPVRRARRRLGRRDGRPLRRPDHRPPADARARRHRRPDARRAHLGPPRARATRCSPPISIIRTSTTPSTTVSERNH